LIKVVNVVATAILDRPIHIDYLPKIFPEKVLYDPATYFCAYFKAERMKGKVSIFPSGKMISVGTRSEEEAKQDLIFVANILERNGIAKLKEPPKVQNVIVITNLERRLDLEKIFKVLPDSIYEPGQFPGLIHRMRDLNPSIVALIFASGKIVCVGAKSEKQAKKAVKNLLSKISCALI